MLNGLAGRRAARVCAPLAVLLTLAAAAPAAFAARPTGRYLVSFDRPTTAQSSSALTNVLSRTGAIKAGRGVPSLGMATVHGSSRALSRLRHDPAVKSVSVEWERDLRRVPRDPALFTPETEFTLGLPPGTPIQWALTRENFPAAWNVTTGGGGVVAVIDSGLDASNPELAGKVASADAIGTTSPLRDRDGHGTHVSGLACAATDNGIGIAGAGWGCRIAVIKVRQTVFGGIRDEDVVAALKRAADRRVDAVNLSFGGGATSAALSQAVDYAVAHGVVLVASASNDDTDDQGAPAIELQNNDSGKLESGRGLVVTAAEFDDTRAGTGYGDGVSLAAYGYFDDGLNGPPGLISAYPREGTPREGFTSLDGCACRRSLADGNHYAYLQGTSMAAPQVAALAALISDLNPFLTLRDKLRVIKSTARRAGGWSPEMGWGIIDAGRAVDAARRIDRRAPRSRARSSVKRVRLRGDGRTVRVRVRWRGSDPAGARGLIPSGIRSYDLLMKRGKGKYRRVRRATRRRSTRLRLRPGTYRFLTRARDRAGNREPRPRRADARLTVRERRR